jgi:hypothetical protein
MQETSQFVGQSTDRVTVRAASRWTVCVCIAVGDFEGWASSGKLQGKGTSSAMLQTHDLS